MNKTVRLYAQTGFDSVNIPDSLEMLETNFTPVAEYHDIDIIQTRYVAKLVLDDLNENVVKKVDYCVIKEGAEYTCYTVEEYAFTSAGVVELHMLIDPYTSIGGFGATSGNLIVSGSANRLTVSKTEDDTKFFTLDEPFSPAERIDNTITKLLAITDSYLIVETVTVPPKTVSAKLPDGASIDGNLDQNYDGAGIGANKLTYTIEGQSTQVYTRMILPRGRKLMPTNYTMSLPDGSSKVISLGTRLWRHDNAAETGNMGIEYEVTVDDKTIKGDLFKDMRDNGRDNDIVAYYEIPTLYCSCTPVKYDPTGDVGSYGGAGNINNLVKLQSTTFSPKTVFNNKAKYSQNCTVKVYSPVSGEQLDKRLYEVCNPGTLPNGTMVGEYFITADVRAEGAPIFGWSYLNGVSQKGTLAETIEGGQWRSVALGIEGMSNINLEQARLDTQFGQQRRQAGVGLIGSVIGGGIAGAKALGAGGALAGSIIPGAGTAAGAGIGAAVGAVGGGLVAGVSWLLTSKKQQEQQQLLDHESIAASAQVSVGSSNFAREMGLNTFCMIVSQYSDYDTWCYDAFLTKFGYNVGNKAISNADFFSRPAFNYVRLNDITIESANASMSMLELVREQLKAGVRVWHKKPNVNDMMPGGNINA